MRNIFDSNDLIIEFSKTTKICEKVQKQITKLRENFINESVNRNFEIDQNENKNFELSLT